ncbi:MAG: sulfite exporter TauE/SafE family protein [Verrucomicrobiota bacterium]
MTLDLETLTLGGLFVAGLATTLHCAGMCGLLTCGLGIAGKGPAMATVGIYHFSRLLGYMIAGTLFGTIGGWLGLKPDFAGLSWLPLFLVVFLFAVCLGLDKKLAAIPGLGKAVTLIRIRSLRFPPNIRAAIVGVSTPLLPCGPLYAILGIAMASGSAVRGAEVMLAFGLGAVPCIWAVQLGSVWMNQRLSAQGFLIAKRTLSACAAFSILWHFSLFGLADEERSEGQDPACRCELIVK